MGAGRRRAFAIRSGECLPPRRVAACFAHDFGHRFALTGEPQMPLRESSVTYLSNEGIEAGLIARTEQQLGQFRADLVHLDVRLFAPEFEPKTIPTKRIRQSD